MTEWLCEQSPGGCLPKMKQTTNAAQARLQFMTCGLPSSAVPASIHCDHLIQAVDGAEADLKVITTTLPSLDRATR